MCFRQFLRFCSMAVFLSFIFSLSIYSKEDPIKPKLRSDFSNTSQFECGTYAGNEKASLTQYYQFLAQKKNGSRLSARDMIFDDVWVVEDDGTILSSNNIFDTDLQTFHFAPNLVGGYDITAMPLGFDTDFGTNLNLGDDTNGTVSFTFSFPFYGVNWSDVHVNANGIVSFGADVNPSGFYDNTDFSNTIPKIAGYFIDLNPAVGGGVFQKSETDKLTITWNNLPEFGTSNSNTFQLVLHADGTFDLSFNNIDATFATSGNPIIVGIHPGGNPSLEVISFSDDIPYNGGAGAGILESYANVVNPQVNEIALHQRFYQSFPDSFFQTIFFTNFTQTMGGFANEQNIENSVQGIGLPLFDNSSFYGSNGVLESRCNMNQLAVWPNDPAQRFFGDGNNFLTIMGQEAGHRWLSFVNFRDSTGNVSNLILGRSDAHWSYYFDVDNSSVEGGNWEQLSGNTFLNPTQVDFFGDIDEYTMGARTPEEVKPSFYVSSPTNDLPQNRSIGTPSQGATATGVAVPVTIDDIIAAEGARIPTEPNQEKDLRQAFILVHQNGTTPSQAELDKIARFRSAWEDYFEKSVDGRLTLNTSITRTFPIAVIEGKIRDINTNNVLQNIQVESVEREFNQFVPNGGRYTFRYMQPQNGGATESVSLVVHRLGYFQETLSTDLTYGNEIQQDFNLTPLTTGTLSGKITGPDGQGAVGVKVILNRSSALLETKDTQLETITDSDGNYTFSSILISYLDEVTYDRITVVPDIPFIAQTLEDNITINDGQTTVLDIELQTADILLVNGDATGNFTLSYANALNNLGVSFFEWKTSERGTNVPVSLLPQFNSPMIVWFTGNADVDVLNQAGQDSLSAFLDNGGKLLLTGKNIAEYLDSQGSSFLSTYLNLTYGGNVAGPPLIRPVSTNPMSGSMSNFSTNQTGRDILSPINGGNAESAFIYTNNTAAGVTVENPGNGSMIAFLGFGFESINSSVDQSALMNAVLNWTNIITGITEDPNGSIPQRFALAQNFPNPFNPSTTIRFSVPMNARVTLSIFNTLGQRVRNLISEDTAPGKYSVVWDGKNDAGQQVASGVYIYQMAANAIDNNGSGSFVQSKKLMLLK